MVTVKELKNAIRDYKKKECKPYSTLTKTGLINYTKEYKIPVKKTESKPKATAKPAAKAKPVQPKPAAKAKPAQPAEKAKPSNKTSTKPPPEPKIEISPEAALKTYQESQDPKVKAADAKIRRKLMTPQERAADDYEKRQKAIAKKWDAKMTPEQREFRLKYEARKKTQADEQKRLDRLESIRILKKEKEKARKELSLIHISEPTRPY